MTMPGERALRVFDTTLRDGEQAPGNSMRTAEKIEVALLLEDLGVNTIEAGFPASSPLDAAAAREIARRVRRATVCCFARCNPADIDAALTALDGAAAPQIELAAVGSDIHLQHKRRITRQEAVRELAQGVEYARGRGVPDVLIGLEDGSRGAPDYLRALVRAGIEAGGTMVVLADTIGRCLPEDMHQLVTQVKAWSGDVPVAVHCHDDLGLAVANTLAAVKAGADEVQVTLCGIGERAGNASFEEVVAAVDARRDALGRTTTIDLRRIPQACGRLLDIISERLPRAKAVIGANAFATEAGIHQQGILRDPSTYELLDPERFGRSRRLVIGRHSGRNIIRYKLGAQRVTPDPVAVDRLYHELLTADDVTAFDDDALLVKRYEAIVAESSA